MRAAQYNLGRGGPCVLPRRQIRIFSREEQAPPLPDEWVITPINRSLEARRHQPFVGDDGLLRFGHATALTAAQGLSFTTVSPLRYLGVPRYVIAIFKAQNQIKSTLSRHFALPIVTGRRGRRPLRINLIVLLSNSDLAVSSPSGGDIRQKVTPPDFSLRPMPPNSDLSN